MRKLLGHKSVEEYAGSETGFVNNGKTYRVYCTNPEKDVESIRKSGLKAPEGTGVNWFMVTTDKKEALFYAHSRKNALIRFDIPTNKMPEYLWPGQSSMSGYHGVQHALRTSLPGKYIASVEILKKFSKEESMNKKELSIFDKHQLAIAKKTMNLSDVGARVMGGMTKEEAKEIIKKFTGKEYKESVMSKAEDLIFSMDEASFSDTVRGYAGRAAGAARAVRGAIRNKVGAIGAKLGPDIPSTARAYHNDLPPSDPYKPRSTGSTKYYGGDSKYQSYQHDQLILAKQVMKMSDKDVADMNAMTKERASTVLSQFAKKYAQELKKDPKFGSNHPVVKLAKVIADATDLEAKSMNKMNKERAAQVLKQFSGGKESHMMTKADQVLQVLSEVVDDKMYKSLNDVYPKGSTKIWYTKGFYNPFGKEKDDITPENISKTHILLGQISETDFDKIFSMMQGERWSPEGEARNLIKGLGLTHTSMSVGDVIEKGKTLYMVDTFGFKNLSTGAEESLSVAKQFTQSLPEVKRVEKRFKMNKTYEVWDEEALEAGDTDDRGFEYEDREFDSLWDMADEIRDGGATEPSDSSGGAHTWYSTPDAEENYRTGEKTFYSFHPDNLSAEEAKELFKLVKMDRSAFREAEPEEGEETEEETADRIEKEREKKNLKLPGME